MIGEAKEEVEMQLRGLSWPAICSLACEAMILGLTFDQMCEQAMREYIAYSPYVGG